MSNSARRREGVERPLTACDEHSSGWYVLLGAPPEWHRRVTVMMVRLLLGRRRLVGPTAALGATAASTPCPFQTPPQVASDSRPDPVTEIGAVGFRWSWQLRHPDEGG
jgi:hypothetical protein